MVSHTGHLATMQKSWAAVWLGVTRRAARADRRPRILPALLRRGRATVEPPVPQAHSVAWATCRCEALLALPDLHRASQRQAILGAPQDGAVGAGKPGRPPAASQVPAAAEPRPLLPPPRSRRTTTPRMPCAPANVGPWRGSANGRARSTPGGAGCAGGEGRGAGAGGSGGAAAGRAVPGQQQQGRCRSIPGRRRRTTTMRWRWTTGRMRAAARRRRRPRARPCPRRGTAQVAPPPAEQRF